MVRTDLLDETLRQSLEAAKAGDREAFAQLAKPYRRELHVHCYRMLGSMMDAEDLVQETLLKAWKGLGTYQARASFRAWLYKIATNACLDELARRPRRALPADLFPEAELSDAGRPPVVEPVWVEPFPDGWLSAVQSNPEARYDQREAITLAFVVALQSLPPRQRAILILRDVLGWGTEEVGALLDASPSAVHSALYRARSALSRAYSQHDLSMLRADAQNADQRDLLDRYVSAWEAADIDGLILLLKEEATFGMPPLSAWYRGRSAIRAFIAGFILDGEARGRWRLVPTRASGRPAFGWYRREAGDDAYRAFALQVVTIDDNLVADVTTFGYPQLFSFFGLPPELAEASGPGAQVP